MKTYANYAFYVEEYGGQLMDEESFKRAIIGATQYLRYITLNRSDLSERDEVKYAACAVADVYYSTVIAEQSGKGSGSGKRSETIDGYSVTYIADRIDGETVESVFKKKAYETAREWLGPLGLLYKGIKSKC